MKRPSAPQKSPATKKTRQTSPQPNNGTRRAGTVPRRARSVSPPASKKTTSRRARSSSPAPLPIVTLPSSGGRMDHDVWKALRMMKDMLSDPATLHSYNTMANINRKLVLNQWDVWTRGERISNRTRTEMAKMFTIKTRAQVHAAMNRVTTFAKRWAAMEPYALIVEFEMKEGMRSWTIDRAKSSAWLAAPVIRALGRPPDVIIPFLIPLDFASVVQIRAALNSGIRSFIHIDDAMYSGQQKQRLLAGLNVPLKEYSNTLHTIDLQRRYGGGFARHLKKSVNNRILRTVRGEKPRLLMATAFSTDSALKLVRKAAKFNKYMDVSVFVGESISVPSAIPLEIQQRTNYQGVKPMTLLPFKVPNSESFVPWTFGTFLQKKLPLPPYFITKFR
jgi:hypothetical protein